MPNEKLTYDDLKLGERARDAFLAGKYPDYIKEHCAVYLNTHTYFDGLNVTDLALAGVLAGMNTLLVGNTGCGKSQLARDIHNYLFNGSKREGGHALTIEGHPELDIYRDVLTDVDREKVQRVLNGTHNALFWDLEEFNRCPPIAQNQFLAIGNGRLIHRGESIPIGEKGYVSSIATANYGNGEFKGTFDVDKALENRFGLVLDLDYPLFQPTKEDRILIDKLREAHPGIKEAPRRDLTGKIIQASREISAATLNPGLEAMAVLNYLKFGLENCQGKDGEQVHTKGKEWPYVCQDCGRNKDGKTLCSLVTAPVPRTLQSMARYASALNYFAKLKNPQQEINPVDLMFRTFELTAAYQNILNPAKLKADFGDEAPKMMAYVAEALKQDFKENQDFILTSLDEARKGNEALDYFKAGSQVSTGYNELDDKAREKATPLKPFNDNRAIGLSWVRDAVDAEIKFANLKKKE